jgi:hypothetical protein
MRRLASTLSIAFIFSLIGCGDSTGDGAGGSGEGGGGGAAQLDPLDISFETGEWEVAPGDVFECFYTNVITEEDLAVQGAIADEIPEGRHHITLYYTESPKEVGHHPCSDEEMLEWRQVAATGGGDENDGYGLPDGLAMRVPAGAQLVIQVHYVNLEPEPVMRNDAVTMNVVDPANVVEYANIHVTLDADFDIPPHSTGSSTTICEVREDTQAVLLLGHMHEWGTRYTLDILNEDLSVAETLYEEDWLPLYSSHPPAFRYPIDEPLVLPAGTLLRQRCEWNNTEEEPLTFPREMCLSFMYYYPDDGERFALCSRVEEP